MIGSYYFWKWADNDLPGRFPEVHAALLHGEMHPALQFFDSAPPISALEETAARDGWGDPTDWSWEIAPRDTPQRARFVFVTCPEINESRQRLEWFYDRFLPLKVSGIDEDGGHNIPCLRPKLNQFIPLHLPEETVYDIGERELPALLRTALSCFHDAEVELLDRHRGVWAVAKRRRFQVEWRENPDCSEPGRFQQWRAQDLKRVEALNGADPASKLPFDRDPDYLLFADVLRIFSSFFRGESRPAGYGWLKVSSSTM